MDAPAAMVVVGAYMQLLACAATAYAVEKKSRRKKRVWARPQLLQRDTLGTNAALLPALRQTDLSSYFNCLRMDERSFATLVDKVRPLLRRQDTTMRSSIPVDNKVAITLRFLATGDSYASLEFLSWISRRTIQKFVPETCRAIYNVLKAEFLKVPSTPEEWKRVSDGFLHRWNLPHCLGALGGKHVKIIAPYNSDWVYFNYKNDFSIVLLAVADSDYNIIYVDVATNGRISDGGVFDNSSLKSAIEGGKILFPEPEPLPGQQSLTPYFFVADNAFALAPYLMKPISGMGLSDESKIYNYRISRGRVVENVFGILGSRFRLFQEVKFLSPETVVEIVLAACVLHNYLRSMANTTYMPTGSVDAENDIHEVVPGDWRAESPPRGWTEFCKSGSGMNSILGLSARNNLIEYFNSEVGSVSWQGAYLD